MRTLHPLRFFATVLPDACASPGRFGGLLDMACDKQCTDAHVLTSCGPPFPLSAELQREPPVSGTATGTTIHTNFTY